MRDEIFHTIGMSLKVGDGRQSCRASVVDTSLKDLIEQLRNRIDLRMDQAREASRQLADPAVSELEKGGFLVALKIKGESGEELGYFARSFLELAIRPDPSVGRQTICGYRRNRGRSSRTDQCLDDLYIPARRGRRGGTEAWK